MQISGRVLFVNPPEGNRRSGSVKLQTTNGIQYVGVERKDLDRFHKGESITVETKSRDYQGRTYYDFVSFAGQESSRSNGASAPQPPAQRSNGAAPPVQSRGGASNDQMIFITGVVGRSMQSGQFGLEDVMALTDAAKNAYERVVLGKTVRSEADFNDSIDHIGSDQDDPSRPPF